MKSIQIDPRARALIFDLDGTLADTMPFHIQAWIDTGIFLNKPITVEMINQLNGTPTYEVVLELNKRYGWRLDPEKVRQYKNDAYKLIVEKNGKIKPIERVYTLAEQNREILPMSIGTGSTRENALKAIHDMGVEHWFCAIVTADDVSKHKPHPDTFLKCAEAMDVVPAQCQVFEDGPMGLIAAREAGMIVTNILDC